MPFGPTPAPLPHRWANAPFTTRAALERGVSPDRLRALDLDHAVRGVRATRGTADELLGRCRMFAERLGGDVFFSHETAARLWDLPLPWRLERGEALHVSVASPRRAPHAHGLIGHSRRLIDGDVAERHGVLVSAPQRLWCELGLTLGIPDLVALGDAILRTADTSLEVLSDRIRAGDPLSRRRRPRIAFPLLDERSESRPESLLRVLLARAGLPTPAVNHVVVATGRERGIRTDLAYPDVRVAIEYQGDHHRSRDQWRADMTRRGRMEALGWFVMEVNADDIRRPAELADRIRRVLGLRSRPV